MNEIAYEPANNKTMLPWAVKVLNDALGDQYYDEDRAKMMMNTGLFLIAFDFLRVVGVTTAYVMDEEDIEGDEDHGDLILPRGKVAMMESSAVVEEYRGRGIGKELFSRRLQWARTQGCTHALAYCWLESPSPSWKIHESLGARTLADVPDWYAGISCSLCDPLERTCTCSARIMQYDLAPVV